MNSYIYYHQHSAFMQVWSETTLIIISRLQTKKKTKNNQTLTLKEHSWWSEARGLVLPVPALRLKGQPECCRLSLTVGAALTVDQSPWTWVSVHTHSTVWKKSIMELEVTFLLPAILFTVFALYFAASLLRPKSGASSTARKRESSGGDRDDEEPQLLLSSAAPAETVSRGRATGDIQQVKCFNFTLRYSVFCLYISFCLM